MRQLLWRYNYLSASDELDAVHHLSELSACFTINRTKYMYIFA
jgi:hypothetical protein